MHKVEMLIRKNRSVLLGIRVYNKSGKVVFTTGYYIEDPDLRNATYNELVTVELEAGERIIGIRSQEYGLGYAWHYNVQFVIGREA